MMIPYAMKPLPCILLVSRRFTTTEKIAYHDVVSQTLAQLPSSAISSKCDSTKKHLCPSKDGVTLADESVYPDSPRPQCFLVNVQLEVYPKNNLRSDRDEHD